MNDFWGRTPRGEGAGDTRASEDASPTQSLHYLHQFWGESLLKYITIARFFFSHREGKVLVRKLLTLTKLRIIWSYIII